MNDSPTPRNQPPRDAVLEVTLDRPKANSIDAATQPDKIARFSPNSATTPPSCAWPS